MQRSFGTALAGHATGDDTEIPVAPDELKRLEGAVALVMARGGDVGQLARTADVSVEVAQRALDHPRTAALLLDAQDRAEDAGHTLRPVASRIALDMLCAVRDAMARGELDVDDIGNLLPKVHKVIEHADRIEATRGGFDHLPTVIITFVDGAMKVEAVTPKADVIDADVIDVDAVEVR